MAFYRSSGFRLIQILTGTVAAVSLAWPGRPEWRATASLRLIHDTHIPWVLWSAVFVIYVALLIRHSSRSSELADWIGLFCGLIFGVALLATFRWDNPFNWVATCFLFDGIAAHYAAARLAHFDRPVS